MKNSMQRIVAVALLLSSFLTAQAGAQQAGAILSTSVGTVPLAIPQPPGYVDASIQAPELVQATSSMVTPASRMLGLFISSSDMQQYLAGKPPEMGRYYAVQTMRAAEPMVFSTAQFAEVRKVFREQQHGLMEKVKGAAQRSMDKGARELGERIDDKTFALKIEDLKGLGVFHDTDTSISFAASSNMAVRIEGKTESAPLVFTTTIALVKGKVVFLYVYNTYRGDADLRWIKVEAERWAAAVQKAN